MTCAFGGPATHHPTAGAFHDIRPLVVLRLITPLQVNFMTYAFGGSGSYSGVGLAEAHAHLIRDKGLKREHFDMVAGHLVASLESLGVAKVS